MMFGKKTGLWKRSLGMKSDVYANHLTRLNASYNDFQQKAFQLTSQIANALPGLTIHDATHLDALWETADLITGSNYPLNPLEGFVLGGAILLHDAALCFEAYCDGQSGVRQTVEWRDALEACRERSRDRCEADIAADADFEAMRRLHAKQAEKLAEFAWQHQSGDKIFLIEDGELRRTYGRLIGQIAASHHWQIEELQKLGNQINAPGDFPLEWRVDPIKIACILRCADAAHIDNRRAPDFLYSLARRQGVSGDHWKAQNWLARVDIDQSDEQKHSLLFTSNHQFGLLDVSSWWIAYDAIALVDAEIKSSNALLSSRSLRQCSPPFSVKNVTGANSPELLSRHILVNGWRPCSAHIHVSNLEKLVRDLGGAQLYGSSDQLSVALREMVQNARDAIAARHRMDRDFKGKIRVRLSTDANDVLIVIVEDNGVGMSERVLTGPLLDFGTSFWISNLVQEEFPGLRSSDFKSVGKFGIGFYSAFMIASTVTVSSRRWEDGLNDVKTLTFPNGLTLRPILSTGRPDGFSSSASTVVTLKLTSSELSSAGVKILRGRIGEQDFYVKFEDYLASLLSGIDVDVEFVDEIENRSEIIHKSVQNLHTVEERFDWIKRISFASYGKTNVNDSDILGVAKRLRYIDPQNPTFGLACLSTQQADRTTYLDVRTIGGLATTVHRRNAEQFCGFMDFTTGSAKRDAGASPAASKSALEAWAREQIALLKSDNVGPLEWISVTSSLSDLRIDPSDVFAALFMSSTGAKICNLEETLRIAESSGLVVFESNINRYVEHWVSVSTFENFPTFKPMKHGHFLSLERENDIPIHEETFIGCLFRYAIKQGLQLQFEERENVVSTPFGLANALIIRAVRATS